jgi:site-specific DNA recombinase
MTTNDVTATGQPGRLAAIYARVSSERQRQDETIHSQTVGLRELATERGLLLSEDLVFEDEGFSGATLERPALERLRDRAAEGAFEVLLCHAPDRLARRYAYQVLLLEELARCGVEVIFAKEPERGGTPEDELLRQFQGMIAEYERAQIAERTRRGKLHRARGGSQAVMSGAPYGYRYVKKSEHMEGFWEIDETEAQVVREVFDRYVNDGVSIGELARWLTDRGIPTRTGKTRWDRSSVWAMLRNPAYRGQAAFGKTKTAERHGGPTRTTRQRGERHGRRLTRTDQPAEKWTLIAVPPLVTEETFALAQERLIANARFATRNTKELTLLQGVLVCRECGYSCYRTSTRTSNKRISYYRCIGQDGWRHPDGKRCTSRPVRADEIDPLVWAEIRRLLEDPAPVRAEIDRRLAALRSEHPAARRRETLERDLTRAEQAVARLIEAYQEQLISLEELRTRMPALRKRQSTLQAQLDSLDAELHDAETYLQLADTIDAFLSRLADGLDQLDTAGQQRILRLVVREVLIGGDGGTVTIRHSIPTPNGGPHGSYPLRGSSRQPRAAERRPARDGAGRRGPLPVAQQGC